jgi:hypothetical protein
MNSDVAMMGLFGKVMNSMMMGLSISQESDCGLFG